MEDTGILAVDLVKKLEAVFCARPFDVRAHRSVDYFVIRGPTGVRWLIPSEGFSILGRIGWRPQKLSSRVFWFLVRLAGRIPILSSIAFKRVSFYFPKAGLDLGDQMQRNTPPCIYVGTPGPFQKLILFFAEDRTAGLVMKVPIGPRAADSIAHELTVCGELSSVSESIVPKSWQVHGFLVQNLVFGSQDPGVFSRQHLDFLIGLHRGARASVGRLWQVHVLDRFKSLGLNFEDLSKWVSDRADFSVPAPIMHGDFSPWNVVLDASGKIAPLDWEHACLEGIPGLDLVHYHLKPMLIHIRVEDVPKAMSSLNQFLRGELMREYMDRIGVPLASREACSTLVFAGLISFVASTEESSFQPAYQRMLSLFSDQVSRSPGFVNRSPDDSLEE